MDQEMPDDSLGGPVHDDKVAPLIADYRKMYERTSTMARIGAWEFDLIAKELRWTDAIYDLFELPRGSPITRDQSLDFYAPQSRREMEQLRSEAIATGGSFSLDIRIRTNRGVVRWLHLTADVEQKNGNSVLIFGTKQDITERKLAQDQVRLLQTELLHSSGRNAMSTMAATLAHELNQPLAAITNYATGVTRLLDTFTVPDLAKDGIREIEANAMRAGEIIRRMRSIVTRGRAEPESVDLEKVIRDAATLGCVNSKDTTCHLQFRHSGAVLADTVQLTQVAVTLIKNACEAVEQTADKVVHVATWDDGEWVVVSVSDNGTGIQDIHTLFDATLSDKMHGMGVGLSISRTIVEAYGGKIWVVPKASGATLCFSVPKVPTTDISSGNAYIPSTDYSAA